MPTFNEHKKFEKDFVNCIQTKSCVAINNGTSSLQMYKETFTKNTLKKIIYSIVDIQRIN